MPKKHPALDLKMIQTIYHAILINRYLLVEFRNFDFCHNFWNFLLSIFRFIHVLTLSKADQQEIPNIETKI